MKAPSLPTISRRRMLATAGVTLTSPLLPSLLYSKRSKAETCGPTRRFVAHGPSDEFGTYYTRNVSWRGPVTENADGSMTYAAGDATPLSKETDPAAIFDRLFAGEDPHATAVERERRRALRKSVLDATGTCRSSRA